MEREELWYQSTGYLVRNVDVDAFLKWAEGVDFWGQWMPRVPEVYHMFLGEHGWSAADRYFRSERYGDSSWVQPREDCPAKVHVLTLEYAKETGSDCSIDEGYRLQLPACELLDGMGLHWNAQRAEYYDSAGRLVAFDPAAQSDGPTAFLIQKDPLEAFLKREDLTVVWTVIGEKRVLGSGLHDTYHGALKMTGLFALRQGKLVGFMKYIEDRASEKGEDRENLLALVRTDPL